MANRNFIKAQMQRLECNYGMDRFKITKQMFELWCEMFQDLNEDGIKASVDEYIRTNEYPPSVASIMKIYSQKDQSRDELGRYLKSKYTWICRWYGEAGNDNTYKQLVDFISKIPAAQRKKSIDEMAYEAVEFYNDCVENGEVVTVGKFLEGYTWTQKDK